MVLTSKSTLDEHDTLMEDSDDSDSHLFINEANANMAETIYPADFEAAAQEIPFSLYQSYRVESDQVHLSWSTAYLRKIWREDRFT
jgi:hypothetical protein